jgi:hypothetical protein
MAQRGAAVTNRPDFTIICDFVEHDRGIRVPEERSEPPVVVDR